MVGVETVPAAEFQNLGQSVPGPGCLKGEGGVDTALPREGLSIGRPLPVLVDEVIKIFGVVCAPFHLVLEFVRSGGSLAASPTQATRNRHQGESSFCFSQQAVINVLSVIVVLIVIVAHPRVPLSSLDRSNDFAILGRDTNF